MGNKRLEKDKLVLLKLLPYMVWNHVLDIKNWDLRSNDLRNICYSSPVFGELLDPNRILFGKVMSLLENYLHRPPQSLPYPPRNPSPIRTVLSKCRSICKAWCNSIDNLAHPMTDNYISCLVTKLTVSRWTRDNPDHELMDHFENSHASSQTKSPFVGNSLNLYFDKQFNVVRGNFGANAYPRPFPFCRVLLRYGHHIRFCMITLACLTSSKIWNATFLHNVLSNMPNLHTFILNLASCMMPHWTMEATGTSVLYNLPTLKRLRQFCAIGCEYDILEKLLPKMPNLQHLDVGHMSNCPTFENSFGNIPPPVILPRVLLPNLRYLGMDMVSQCAQFRLQKYMYNFDQEVPSVPEDGAFHFLFKTLNAHWGLEIRDLELHVNISNEVPAVWYEWRRYPIYFPHLRNMMLYTQNWPCIDFVIQVQSSLEHLGVVVESEQSLEEWKQSLQYDHVFKDESIKFLSCHPNMSESNIWDMLPNLKTLTVLLDSERCWKRPFSTYV